jgi:hypothetical protein
MGATALTAEKRTRQTIDFIGEARQDSDLQPDRYERKDIARLLDFSAFSSDRACSLRFGEVVSGAKLVRCASRRWSQRRLRGVRASGSFPNLPSVASEPTMTSRGIFGEGPLLEPFGQGPLCGHYQAESGRCADSRFR